MGTILRRAIRRTAIDHPGLTLGRPARRPIATALSAAALLLAASASGAETLRFSRFNQSYRDPLPPLPPFQQGPLTVVVSVPSYYVTLRDHTLELTPLPDGTHRARLSLEFLGRGELVADLAVGASSNRLEDEVTAPLQRSTLEGRVALERGESGYLLTLIELPPRFEVEVHSRLAGDLASMCQGFAVLALGALDCDGLERSLSRLAVPLPRPGEQRFLADEDLAPEERAALDSYLAAAPAQRGEASPGPPPDTPQDPSAGGPP